MGGGDIIATATKTNDALREKLGATPANENINYLNLLIYGEPGAGKTWLLGTAADHELTGPLLIIDVEGGVTTIRKRRDVDVVQVRSTAQIVDLCNSLYNENNGYYKTIGIDSVTELQKLDMHDIMKEVKRQHDDRDIDVPSQREWGKSGERIRRIVRAFRDLECNTIMTALAVLDKSESGAISYHPSLPGKLRGEVPGFFDIVGYLRAESEGDTVVRKLQLAKTQRVVAKDRTDSLGAMIENPTIPEMWSMIVNGQGT